MGQLELRGEGWRSNLCDQSCLGLDCAELGFGTGFGFNCSTSDDHAYSLARMMTTKLSICSCYFTASLHCFVPTLQANYMMMTMMMILKLKKFSYTQADCDVPVQEIVGKMDKGKKCTSEEGKAPAGIDGIQQLVGRRRPIVKTRKLSDVSCEAGGHVTRWRSSGRRQNQTRIECEELVDSRSINEIVCDCVCGVDEWGRRRPVRPSVRPSGCRLSGARHKAGLIVLQCSRDCRRRQSSLHVRGRSPLLRSRSTTILHCVTHVDTHHQQETGITHSTSPFFFQSFY